MQANVKGASPASSNTTGISLFPLLKSLYNAIKENNPAYFMNPNNNLSLIIEPSELEPHLGSDNLLVIDLCNPQLYAQVHVPGAINVRPQQLVAGTQPATGKLPSLEQIQALFRQLGFTGKEHVVVYDDEGGGWAGRFIWTLDVIGHQQYSYLNGGIHAWIKEGHAKESTINKPEPSSIELNFDLSPVASVDYIINSLDDPETAIWDARSPGEYSGERIMAKKGGHIPGAINFEWTRAMDPENNFRIRSNLKAELADLGLTTDKEIITHCQTHHRSGFTYLVAKALGFKHVRGYDGSWSEWGNLDHTPVEV